MNHIFQKSQLISTSLRRWQHLQETLMASGSQSLQNHDLLIVPIWLFVDYGVLEVSIFPTLITCQWQWLPSLPPAMITLRHCKCKSLLKASEAGFVILVVQMRRRRQRGTWLCSLCQLHLRVQLLSTLAKQATSHLVCKSQGHAENVWLDCEQYLCVNDICIITFCSYPLLGTWTTSVTEWYLNLGAKAALLVLTLPSFRLK